MFTTDVLIVGAGPAGLATALSALRHGARVLVVERRAGPSTVPRATGISIHTMEVLRGWGVADAALRGSIACEPTVTITDRLPDPPHEVVPLAWPSVREILAASPAFPAVVPQDHLEPVLVDEVRRLGGTVRFGAALTALRTTGDGVRAVVGGCAGAGPVRGRRRRAAQHRAHGAGHRRGAARRDRGVHADPLPRRRDAVAAERAELRQAPRRRGCAAAAGVRAVGVRPGRAGAVAGGVGAGHRAGAGRARDVAVHDGRRGGERVPRRAGLPRRRRRAPHDALRRGRAEHRRPRRARAGLAAGLGGPRDRGGRTAVELRRGARTGGAGDRAAQPQHRAAPRRRPAARPGQHLPVRGDRRRRRRPRDRPPPNGPAGGAGAARVVPGRRPAAVDARPVRGADDRARRAGGAVGAAGRDRVRRRAGRRQAAARRGGTGPAHRRRGAGGWWGTRAA